MLAELLGLVMSSIFYVALHVTGGGSFPRPLSAEEERKCLELYKESGDNEARNTLIEHNLRLVAHIVKKYYTPLQDQDDLISIGTLGLIKAVSTFNGDKQTRLATYAARCIENEILMHFRSQKKTAGNVFIFDPIDTDKDGNALTLLDIIADENSIIDDIDLKIKSEKLGTYINECLDDRARAIIILRYGLSGMNELTQREVAGKLKISRSYVSRIEKKSLMLLRDRFESFG